MKITKLVSFGDLEPMVHQIKVFYQKSHPRMRAYQNRLACRLEVILLIQLRLPTKKLLKVEKSEFDDIQRRNNQLIKIKWER
jgi:hypothetical protein